MDYHNLKYEYNIASNLYIKYKLIILEELNKVIISYIDIITKLLRNKNYTDTDIIIFFKTNMFFENTDEYGHIKTTELLSSITTIDNLIELTNKMNIREKMTFIKNFQRSNTINCIMYEMLLEYKKDNAAFKQKFDKINIAQVEKVIKTIENLLDFKIEETNLCYDNEYNQTPCDDKNNKFYIVVNEDPEKFENDYPKICNLWIPVVYLFNYQNLIKGEKCNRLSKLIKSFEPNKQKSEHDYRCINDILSRFPLIEQLSDREQKLLKEKLLQKYSVEGLPVESMLPFKLIICSMNKTQSFYIKLRDRKNKLSISYSSGHTLMMLLLMNYIQDINLYYVIIALIIWTVPYNHSINEILSASKQYGLFDNYDYDKSTLDNLNTMLSQATLERINID